MSLPETAGENLVDEVLGIVDLHLQLFEDDAFFLLDILGGKEGITDQMGDDIEGFRQMLVKHLDVIADEFLRRERVESAANRIDRPRNLLGRAVLCPLKKHVLD